MSRSETDHLHVPVPPVPVSVTVSPFSDGNGHRYTSCRDVSCPGSEWDGESSTVVIVLYFLIVSPSFPLDFTFDVGEVDGTIDVHGR